jgi:hypothetical protein
MKMASIYIGKEEIAKKLGIEADQFVFGKVEGNLYEVQFDVIIDSNTEVKNATDVSDNHWNIRRQRFEDMGG